MTKIIIEPDFFRTDSGADGDVVSRDIVYFYDEKHNALENREVSNEDWPGAVFYGVSLKNTVFSECNLFTADFRGAKFSGTTFIDCDLWGAAFDGNVKGVQFTRCIFTRQYGD